jgi:exosortase/archaeosortase family protein
VKGNKPNKKKDLRQSKALTKKNVFFYFGLNKRILFFIIKFFIIFFILNLVVELLPLDFLTSSLALFVGNLLGLQVLNNVVLVNDSTFIIGNMCTGLTSASILAAIIFSLSRPTLSKKIIFFLTGLVLLLLVNVPRLILVLYFAKQGYDAGLVHELTWFFMSAVVLFIWYYWNKKILGVKDFSELV